MPDEGFSFVTSIGDGLAGAAAYAERRDGDEIRLALTPVSGFVYTRR